MTDPSVAAEVTRVPDRVLRFLTSSPPPFAVVATLDPDGAPRQAVAWFRLEPDGRILLNSRARRRWPANLLRDGRLSIAVVDPGDFLSWVGLEGAVDEVVDDVKRARADIIALANRYHPDGPNPSDIAAFRTQQRITFLVRIDGVHEHLAD